MFSKSCKYGIRAVLYLASFESHSKKGVKEIAEALKVPAPFLAKILQQLAKAGLISSAKGPGGGFFLSEKNLRSNIDDIINCIDGPELMHSCVLGLPSCSNVRPCPLHVQAIAYRQGLQYQLEHQTIQELAKGIKREQLNF